MVPTRPPETNKMEVWFWPFCVWFFLCVVFYLYKIPLHLIGAFNALAGSVPSFNLSQFIDIESSHLATAVIALMCLAVLLATGERFVHFFASWRMTRLETWVWSLALGFLVWGLFAQGLGLVGLLFPLLMKILSVIALAIFLVCDRVRTISRCWPFEKGEKLAWPWKWVLILYLVLTFANLLAPEMSWDAITYQLVLPRYYLEHHGFYSVPGMVPAHYPSLGQMFFSWGLLWGNDSVARFFCFFSHIAIALVLVTLGERLHSKRTGWYAAAFYWFFPYLNIYSSRGYVDLFAGFYGTLSMATLVWSVLGDKKGNEKAHLVLPAIALGAVWGIKYNAAVYTLAALFVLFWKLEKTASKVFFATLVGLATLFFAGAWLLKSWEYVHDPFYPYLTDRFNAMDWNGFDTKASFMKFPVEGLKGLLKLPLVLYGIFFSNYSGAPNEEVSLALLAFAPLSLLHPEGQHRRKVLFLAAVVPFFCWLVTSHQLRLISSVIALTSFIVAIGFEKALVTWKEHGKLLVLMPLLLVFMAAGYLFQGLLIQPNPYFNFLGLQTRDQFLTPLMRPVGYVDMNNYLDQMLAKDVRVLVIGQQNAYYLQRESIYDFEYHHSLLKEWADESGTPEELYHWFLKNNVGYLVYDSSSAMGEVVRLEGLGVDRYVWDPKRLHNYEQFFLHYTTKMSLPFNDGYILYRIEPRPGFSTLPDFLPGTAKYYLDHMVQLMGLKNPNDIVGRPIPGDVYTETYRWIADNHPELGLPCFQAALADLVTGRTSTDEVLRRGHVGLERNGDLALWNELQADVLIQKGKGKKSIPFLEKAQALGPEKEAVARNLAVGYYNEHRLPAAVNEAKRAVQIAPYSQDDQKLLAQLEALSTEH